MQEFKEPKPNLIVTEACKAILPFWLRFKERLSIDIRGSKEDLAAFSRHKRAVVLLNHPDRQDPFVVFQLARQMHEQFYCIAARECFDWDGGRRGWLFQSLGCYSVTRGRPDFHSIATTEKLLRAGERKLVVFPEAEITGDDSAIHELHEAIFHIILDVQKELSQGDSSYFEDSVVIIPAAIKVSLLSGLQAAVRPALRNIEGRLALKAEKGKDVFARISSIVDAYLSRVYDSYGLQKPEVSLDKLAEDAAMQILDKLASSSGADCRAGLNCTERLYDIRNEMTTNIEADSVALQPQAFHCAGIARPCVRSDFERIERLLILQRLLAHPQSKIPCCRMLDFIESELTGIITPKGRQSCAVSIGAPIEISNFVELYLQSREKGVDALSGHFKQKLQTLLSGL